ncbi:MAG TPA: hypothetical protein VNH13_03805 [Candidatus Acidoferrales bacterium]|jgi:hypothetical protein|nr:hypothetical protein [Candidatus Acidoferrales bacterium]
MPGQDNRTPADAEARMHAFLAKPEHQHNKPNKPTHEDDLVPDPGEEPDWHKQGRLTPPGWKQHGDTFVEE